MFTPTPAPRRAVALLAASLAAMPAVAQSTPDDPAAAVPATRYETAHVQRAPAVPAATPDRNWQESNRVVASQPAHGAHAGHAGHAGHAKPADQPAPKADPHDHHHHHEEHH